MSTRKLLTNGNAFKRTDNRWGGVVWYMDESGERKRKSFSGATKAEVNKKMTEYIAAQDKENLPTSETITVFTPEELKIFKDEALSTFSNGKRKYQQAAAYILMLNTGLRTGEVLGLLNSDIDLEKSNAP